MYIRRLLSMNSTSRDSPLTDGLLFNVTFCFVYYSRLAMCSVDPMQSVLYGGPRPGITPSYHQFGLQLSLAGLGASTGDHVGSLAGVKLLSEPRTCTDDTNGNRRIFN